MTWRCGRRKTRDVSAKWIDRSRHRNGTRREQQLPVGVRGSHESGGAGGLGADGRHAVRTLQRVLGTVRVRRAPNAQHVLVTRVRRRHLRNVKLSNASGTTVDCDGRRARDTTGRKPEIRPTACRANNRFVTTVGLG